MQVTEMIPRVLGGEHPDKLTKRQQPWFDAGEPGKVQGD